MWTDGVTLLEQTEALLSQALVHGTSDHACVCAVDSENLVLGIHQRDSQFDVFNQRAIALIDFSATGFRLPTLRYVQARCDDSGGFSTVVQREAAQHFGVEGTSVFPSGDEVADVTALLFYLRDEGLDPFR